MSKKKNSSVIFINELNTLILIKTDNRPVKLSKIKFNTHKNHEFAFKYLVERTLHSIKLNFFKIYTYLYVHFSVKK